MVTNTKTYRISAFYILFLIVSTFLWYFLITKSFINIINFTKYTTQNIQNIFNKDMKDSIIDRIFNSDLSIVTIDTYNKFYVDITAEYRENKYLSLYDTSSYKDFIIVPKAYPSLEIGNEKIYNVGNFVYKITLISIEFFLLIGTVYVLIKKRNKNVALEKEYICLCLAGEILLVITVILPYASIGYNFDRLYMQAMIVLSLVEVIGGIAVFNFLFRRHELSIRILTVFLIINFSYTYGFIWQLIGRKTVSWMNNFGYSYSQSYTHETEVYSAKWLGKIPGNPLIYSTPPGRNMLWAYGKKNNIKTDIFPATIDKNAYVYVTNTSLNEKIATLSYRGQHLCYDYPYSFVNKNKNKVYSNGGSEIYQ